MKLNQYVGTFFVIAGIVGFFTVADDLRHVGEILGVASIVVAGIVMLAGSVASLPLTHLPARWIALGILAGIPIGAGLDNMIFGVTVGTGSGILCGMPIILKRHSGRDLK